MKLSDAAVRNAKANGKVQKLSDGGGLYLHVTATGSKLLRLAYRFEGKQKLLSFGAYPAVSLADARHLIEEWRQDYNCNRPHSALGWQSPETYRATHQPSNLTGITNLSLISGRGDGQKNTKNIA